jgi:hypothetical protein
VQDKSWVLTDVPKGIWVETLDLDASALGLGRGIRAGVRKFRLHGGLSDGVDVVEIDNGVLQFTVLPTRGMSVWRGTCQGVRLGWDSPVRGPVHPQFVNALARGGIGWLGGFDEWIVRCGLDSNGKPGLDTISDNQGNPMEVELSLHGRVANLPAWRVEVGIRNGAVPVLYVRGVVDECMMYGACLRLEAEFCTALGSSRLEIHDAVSNLRAVPAEAQILYHCNFGTPWLEAGARLHVPASQSAPRDARATEGISTWDVYPGPVAGFVEQCYWHVPIANEAGQSLAMLENPGAGRAVVLRFDVRQLPYFTQWKQCGAVQDGYVTGLEPATNFPNARAFERRHGRIVKLGPGERHPMDLGFEFLFEAGRIDAVRQEIDSLRSQRTVLVHPQPQQKFSDI